MPAQAAAGSAAADHFPVNNPARTDPPSGLSLATQRTLEQLAHAVRGLMQEGVESPQHLGEQVKRLGLGYEEGLGHALRRLPPGSDTEAIQSALQGASRFDPDTGPALKQALLLAGQAATELQASGLGGLNQDISTLLRHITGQQLMQTPGQERADLLYQFAAVPMHIGDRDTTVELHVMSRKGPGQKRIDPANCYILFRLDMPNLGELDIHLHIVDKVVGLRFQSAPGTEPPEILPEEQRTLREALTGVGFHLGVIKSEEKQPPEPGHPLPLLPPVLTQGALDLKL